MNISAFLVWKRQMHYLYTITNILENKIYIGQTITPRARWLNHKGQCRKNKPTQYIHRAMIKYGVENFIFEVIATCRTQEDANETEIILIKQYDSQNKDYGYNIECGGNTSPRSPETIERFKATVAMWSNEKKAEISKKIGDGNRGKAVILSQEMVEQLRKWAQNNIGKPRSKETKKRISDSHKGKKLSEETKQKMSQAQRDKIRGPRTQETRDKISKSNTGKRHSEETLKRIAASHRKLSDKQMLEMLQLRNNGASIQELSVKFGCSINTIYVYLRQAGLPKNSNPVQSRTI